MQVAIFPVRTPFGKAYGTMWQGEHDKESHHSQYFCFADAYAHCLVMLKNAEFEEYEKPKKKDGLQSPPSPSE